MAESWTRGLLSVSTAIFLLNWGIGATTTTVCPRGWLHFSHSCYAFVDDHLNWFDAKISCESVGGHLVEIESDVENTFVINYFRARGARTAWIGLTDIGEDGHFVWATNSQPTNFTHWAAFEPNNYHGREDCISINTYLPPQYWNDDSCQTTRMSAVCEKRLCSPTTACQTAQKATGSVVSSCPSGWTRHGDSCYKYFPNGYNWFAAKMVCEDLQGGKLAEIGSAEENTFLLSYLRSMRAGKVWIGAQDLAAEGRFVWTFSRMPVAYNHWALGEPNDYQHTEDCALISIVEYGGNWVDSSCDGTMASFVCEAEFCTDIMCVVQNAQWHNHLVS